MMRHSKSDTCPMSKAITPLASGVLLACTLAACQPADAPPAKPRVVLVQTIGQASGEQRIYTGEIRARHEADLAFRVGGRLVARLVDIGAEIKPGQALARLDPADLQLAADAAKAQLSAAESDLTTSKAERDRYAGLLAKKFVSQAAYDSKENAFNAASARLEQARAQRRLSDNQAAYGSLSSEYPAVVTAVLVDAGQVVAAGQPVLRVARPEEKEVAIAVPESRLDEIRNTREFTVDLWSDPKTALRGELRELSPAADPSTRTYAARIRIKQAPATVRLGMTARVGLSSVAHGPLEVPLSAVVDLGKGPQVVVVSAGKAVFRPVRVAAFGETGVRISDGLQAGEQIVISGANRLVDGQAVEARQPTAPERQR